MSFQRLPGDFKCLSNKEQSRRQREEKGPLLSRGLRLPIMLSTCWQVGCHCVCLATQLPSSPPLQHPITFHPALLQLAACCGAEAPRTFRQMEETKEKDGGRRKIRESLAHALIWEIFHSDKTDDEKVIRVKVRSWTSYLLLSCRNSSNFWFFFESQQGNPCHCRSRRDSVF